ncbi:hypothetical protein A2291_00340 [candidate division WOR-1 bacterium RIFOXYB2_FULL_42_35]|uniref:Uncharacterized protein n=1 Tax=candidate division WOR-1 bacterium RIFOXYC2_FULL_41_25 TaxID=1802586 RepID=A0A1F4TP89_UNCSA|nr:MAG: hypothetical protein A2247_01475 [candidate division WOR-1 bacterium RIFOXYA2_FULL_41_14]OGC24250.1 MAG: hypothetical protein A2291_00340 [candidate division WOR-1 bacterium RIFOXYB2_FULL_42_35]OGC33893.1 MAG: hypothetical protein A2462_01310 [candidate division WOR-1 bacterium RIFOXYC2_FULL_41_25]OGC43895.1 MAG: hypothetical protein A2548_02810 [candidate division WOR-1 bacterium RIFOXYD2_FULL_41_8]
MDYWQYEKKLNIKQLRKMSGEKSFAAGFSLLRMAMSFLKSSIINEHPKIKPDVLHKEIRKYLWSAQR